ncbi:hypothetical protein COCMIDRAFT_104424 [Bipolaris oryzae ATCC 44560]|uniref:BZIP domain-containing protein n=1 Tax=Bipolaris oryzae ATCC 44560 TaxID=930090 RepID=W6YX57_COCMI|nr:uncharacterized protein COCMIDRAFT_104424 [Bipolaris oryzae ATCC 44560]EUC42108.1 hypothetical protein COCMIDRAFT_104424 [Bipolaris oryzae ATCC 44560]
MPPRTTRSNGVASKRDGNNIETSNIETSSGETSKNEGRSNRGRVSKETSMAKKRTQNRIAQQCLRERRAASNRHADRILDTMQTVTEPERLTMLLEAQANLTRENQRMEDALFRMRKKLLSLSNAAATAANDPIFEELLGRKLSSSNNSTPGEQQEDMPTTPTESPKQDQICLASLPQDARSVDNGDIQAFLEAPSVAEEQGASQLFTFDQDFQCQQEYGVQLQEDTEFFNALADNQQTSAYNFRTTPLPTSPSPWDICSFAPPENITIRRATDFSTKMSQAAMNCRARIQDTVMAAHLTTSQITQLVAVATVNLLSTCAGMQEFLYGTNSAVYMERVVYWRLAKTDRSLVPQPYRPTPLQSHFLENGFFPIIDFQPWPELRDQCLIIGDKIDANELSRDIVLNQVIEIPERNVAVHIWQQFQHLHGGAQFNLSTAEPQVPRSANDEGWVFFEINRVNRDFPSWAADPVEEALSRQLLRRIEEFCTGNDLSWFLGAVQNQHLGASTHIESPLVALDSRFRPIKTDMGQRLAATGRWKLSKEFKAKYPQLDCSAGKQASTPPEMDALLTDLAV